MERLKRQRPKQ